MMTNDQWNRVWLLYGQEVEINAPTISALLGVQIDERTLGLIKQRFQDRAIQELSERDDC